MIKKCPYCGKEFATAKERKYCSEECAKEGLAWNKKMTWYRKRLEKDMERRDAEQKKAKSASLDAKMAEAKAKGMSYGQLQALKFIEDMKKQTK